MVLIRRMLFPCFRLPCLISQAQRGRDEQYDQESSVSSQNFFGKIGKSIDGVKCKCLLGNLSPSGSGSLKFTLCD